MGVAHIVGELDADNALARIGPRYPLLSDGRIVFFGYEPNPDRSENASRAVQAMPCYSAARVRNDPTSVATEACMQVEHLARCFALHFDVDAMNFMDVPIADVPQHYAGLTFRKRWRVWMSSSPARSSPP